MSSPTSNSSKKQSRREFCTNACQAASLAALAGALGTALTGCGSTSASPTSPSGSGGFSSLPTIGATETNGSLVLAVGAGSPLAVMGGAALVQTQSRYLLVARTGTDTFSALSAICTHESCTVSGFTNQSYVCPCHGARFDLEGRVLAGPARSPLRSYPTQLAGDELTILT